MWLMQMHDMWEHGVFGCFFNRIGGLAQNSLTCWKEIFCCTPQTKQRLLRKCVKCPYPDLTTKLPSDCSMVWYFKWVYMKESIVIKKTGKVRVIIKVAETPLTQPPINPETLDELLSNLELFLTHEERIKHQYCHIKTLKRKTLRNMNL